MPACVYAWPRLTCIRYRITSLSFNQLVQLSNSKMNHSVRKNSRLLIAHINASSLVSHIDDVREIFRSNVYDIIGVSETWAQPNILDTYLQIPGYVLYRHDRVRSRGGGVATYVRRGLQAKVVFISEANHCAKCAEFLGLEILLRETTARKMLIIQAYKAPDVKCLEQLADMVIQYGPPYSHIFVMGDLNINWDSDHYSPRKSELEFILSTLNLSVIPTNKTHHAPTSSSRIDLMMFSHPSLVISVHQKPIPAVSRHDLISCAINIIPNTVSPPRPTVRRFHKINQALFLDDAARLPWSGVFQATNIDSKVALLNSLILSLYDKHAPLQAPGTGRSSDWITPEIRTARRNKDRAKRAFEKDRTPESRVIYNRLRNKVQQLIRNEKTRQAYRLFGPHVSSKRLWSNIRNRGLASARGGASKIITYSPDLLNNCFLDVCPLIPTEITATLATLRDTPSITSDPLYLAPITSWDINKILTSITTTSVGADGISAPMLKKLEDYVIPSLEEIINLSLNSSAVPRLWTDAAVTPVPKIPNPKSPTDFRPICISSPAAKILEKAVYHQTVTYLNDNNVLDKYQSGFRPAHNCTTALVHIHDEIKEGMDKGQLTILVLLDFSKAFDSIVHDILFEKLRIIGLSTPAVDWFRSLLSQRTQYVRVDGNHSRPASVTRGVPQGSSLAPLLFSIYINDLAKVIMHSKYHLYADDLQVYISCRPDELPRTISSLNLELENISGWARANGLRLNPGKTQVILLGNYTLLQRVNTLDLPPVLLDGVSLEYLSKVKNLGVHMDRTLSGEPWISHVSGGACAILNRLYRCGATYLPLSARRTLVNALILPKFDYGGHLHTGLTAAREHKLQKIQNRCARFVYRLPYGSELSPAYKDWGLLRLRERRIWQLLILFFKSIVLAGGPPYLMDRFAQFSDLHNHSTRNRANAYILPRIKTEAMAGSFKFSAAKIWNGLPTQIYRNERGGYVTPYVFKRRLRVHLMGGTETNFYT